MNNDSRLVYSTEHGNICPKCKKTFRKCKCQATKQPAKNDGVVRVRRETKGRKGKGVTTVSGVPLSREDLKKLAKELKTMCGSGGTIKDGIIEIQGDHCAVVIEKLKSRGWTVKRAGG